MNFTDKLRARGKHQKSAAETVLKTLRWELYMSTRVYGQARSPMWQYVRLLNVVQLHVCAKHTFRLGAHCKVQLVV